MSNRILPVLLVMLNDHLTVKEYFPLPFVLKLLLQILASHHQMKLGLCLSRYYTNMLYFQIQNNHCEIPHHLQQIIHTDFFYVLIVLPLQSPQYLSD